MHRQGRRRFVSPTSAASGHVESTHVRKYTAPTTSNAPSESDGQGKEPRPILGSVTRRPLCGRRELIPRSKEERSTGVEPIYTRGRGRGGDRYPPNVLASVAVARGKMDSWAEGMPSSIRDEHEDQAASHRRPSRPEKQVDFRKNNNAQNHAVGTSTIMPSHNMPPSKPKRA